MSERAPLIGEIFRAVDDFGAAVSAQKTAELCNWETELTATTITVEEQRKRVRLMIHAALAIDPATLTDRLARLTAEAEQRTLTGGR